MPSLETTFDLLGEEVNLRYEYNYHPQSSHGEEEIEVLSVEAFRKVDNIFNPHWERVELLAMMSKSQLAAIEEQIRQHEEEKRQWWKESA